MRDELSQCLNPTVTCSYRLSSRQSLLQTSFYPQLDIKHRLQFLSLSYLLHRNSCRYLLLHCLQDQWRPSLHRRLRIAGAKSMYAQTILNIAFGCCTGEASDRVFSGCIRYGQGNANIPLHRAEVHDGAAL